MKSLGYEVSVNIMAVSHALEPDLDEALDQLAQTDFEMVYLVDSRIFLLGTDPLPGREISCEIAGQTNRRSLP